MIRYQVTAENPHRHFISFEAQFPHSGRGNLQFQLPSWRPGRYELGFFAKNIRGWQATDADGRPLGFRKRTRDLWEVEAEGVTSVRICYQYYGAELNAGSSYLDEEQLYINPVNCFFYIPTRQELAYEVHFVLPEAYEIACGLPHSGRHTLQAAGFDELADCPLIASASLRHLRYEARGIQFRIWIQGEHRLDEELLLNQFRRFSECQIDLFGGFPVKEYHFLFQFTPYFVRHGVEHRNSTVIAMGPVADFLLESWYSRFLGISSHELFHTWNVKAIRPADMKPYRFHEENYSRLGYVTEGVTTYYGDLLLLRSGIYSWPQMLEILSSHIQEYMDNPGRSALSLAESSFDTWLDGYSAGIPWRKVSIYNEGALVAWICDMRIRKSSGGRRSLDDVMRVMNERFGDGRAGYTEEDYKGIVEEVSGQSFGDVFSRLIYGVEDYTPLLLEAAEALGLEWLKTPSSRWSEAALGFSLDESRYPPVVNAVVPGSPGDRSGIWLDDEIISVNGIAPGKNVQHLLRMQSGREMLFRVMRKGREIVLRMWEDGQTWKWKHELRERADVSTTAVALREGWSQAPA